MEHPPQTPEEESIFQPEEFSMEGYDKHIRNARIMLFVIAGLILVQIYTLMPFDENPMKIFIAIFIVVVAGVFVALAFWTKKKPFTAILIALIVFVALQVLAAVGDPATLLQGWLLKIAVIVMLILGLRNARESQHLMEAFGKKS